MYYADKPINSIKEDLFHRGNFAKNLAQTIANMKQQSDTYTIGLFGKWGTGKTSLINMITQNLEEKSNIIVLRFDPWNFSDTNQLIDQFFIMLSNAFKTKSDKAMEEISNAIDKYSDAIEYTKKIPVYGEKIYKIGKMALSVYSYITDKEGSQKYDVNQQKKHVEKLLKKQSNRILIIIDDIDRLSNEHIRYIFQLVTAVAKFPNITYLLSFDRGVVVNALEEVQKGDGNEYLEKVIQMAITIPNIQDNELYDILVHYLERIMANHEDLTLSRERWERLYDPCIRPMIKSIRDINRLSNTIQFKLGDIASEVNFIDMTILSVIELFYPYIYEWISKNKGILTGSDFAFAIKDKPQTEWLKIFEKEFEKLLKANIKKNDFEEDLKYLIECISRLFPYFGQRIGKVYETNDSDLFIRNNQVAHSEKFDRYFQLNIDNIKIRKKPTLIIIYGLTSDEIKRKFIELEKEGYCEELLREINSIKNEIPEDRTKILIKSLLEASKEFSYTSPGIFSLSTARYSEMLVYDLFENITESKRLEFFKEVSETLNFKCFGSLANVINQIELSYGRLAANGQEHNYGKIISLRELEELEKIFVENVKEHLKTINLFDITKWRMVYYLMECYDSEYTEKYLEKSLTQNLNILKFLPCSVNLWVGTSKRYELNDEYKKYLSEEQIINAIDACIESKEILELNADIKERCGAMYLLVKERKKEVSDKDINKLLDEWNNDWVI